MMCFYKKGIGLNKPLGTFSRRGMIFDRAPITQLINYIKPTLSHFFFSLILLEVVHLGLEENDPKLPCSFVESHC